MHGPAHDIGPMVARLAEHDASRVVARLARHLGPARLDLAEDAVQHALMQALRLWPRTGAPERPAAWLFTVARNHARDVTRREARQGELGDLLDTLPAPEVSEPGPRFARELSDDELVLLFAACHPCLPPESRIAFALKWVCGLSARQIASGLLSSEAAIVKRLQRARRDLVAHGVTLEPLSDADMARRMEAVRTSLLLFFNEGYAASSGKRASAPEICNEATRLAVALAGHPVTTSPASDALAALLLLTQARLPARLSADAELVLLEAQDRALWDRELIGAGLSYLARSAHGETVSVWHLRAEIAAMHAIASSAEQTGWPRIREAYERLCALDASPVAALGRAVAIGKVEGPKAAFGALRPVLRAVPDNPYVQAAAGKFLLEMDKPRSAARRFRRAEAMAHTPPERRLMARWLRQADG